MRDAGLPPGWQETSLGELGSFFRGRGGTKTDEEPNGLPCIRYGDLYTHHDCIVRSFASTISPASTSSYTLLQHGDVVFAGSGETFEEIGKAAAYCDDAVAYAGADTIIFRPGPDLLPHFAGYALNSERANAHKSRLGQGSSVIHIGSEHLSKMPFKLPPHEQQQRIAEILSTLDEAIEQTEELIAKTQQIKAGLMHDLFTRGVTADGHLRPRREEAPQLYKESPLGWIPRVWDLSELGKEVRFASGYAFKHYELAEEGTKVVRISNLHRPEFPYWRYQGPIKTDWVVEDGNLLFSWAGVASSINAHIYRGDTALLNQHIYNFHQSDEELKCWIYHCLKFSLPKLREEIEGGAGQLHLTKRHIQRIPIPLPKPQERALLLSRFAAIDEKLAADEQLAENLRMQKIGLMRDLLSGRIPVTVESALEPQRAATNV